MDSQEDEQLEQSEPDVEFFYCKVGLAMIALFDGFKDNRAFETSEGVRKVVTRRRRLSKAKYFGEVMNPQPCVKIISADDKICYKDNPKAKKIKESFPPPSLPN